VNTLNTRIIRNNFTQYLHALAVNASNSVMMSAVADTEVTAYALEVVSATTLSPSHVPTHAPQSAAATGLFSTIGGPEIAIIVVGALVVCCVAVTLVFFCQTIDTSVDENPFYFANAGIDKRKSASFGLGQVYDAHQSLAIRKGNLVYENEHYDRESTGAYDDRIASRDL
jgi:hypothetical protein